MRFFRWGLAATALLVASIATPGRIWALTQGGSTGWPTRTVQVQFNAP